MLAEIDWFTVWCWLVLVLLFSIFTTLNQIGKVLQHIAQTHTELHMDELLEIRRRDEGRD